VQNDGFAFVHDGQPELVYGAYVTPDFFRVLHVSPVLGRTFEADDERPQAPLKAVISHAFWREQLHGDPSIVGTSLQIAGVSATVAGVMPAGFWFPRGDRSDVWLTERIAPPAQQGPWFFNGLARLKPGVTLAQAQGELDGAAALARQRFPHNFTDWTIAARPLKQQLVGDLRPMLLML